MIGTGRNGDVFTTVYFLSSVIDTLYRVSATGNFR
jgi:hypothetical protein